MKRCKTRNAVQRALKHSRMQLGGHCRGLRFPPELEWLLPPQQLLQTMQMRQWHVLLPQGLISALGRYIPSNPSKFAMAFVHF